MVYNFPFGSNPRPAASLQPVRAGRAKDTGQGLARKSLAGGPGCRRAHSEVTVLFIALAAIVFVACLGFIERLWQRHELKRTARQWDERERLLARIIHEGPQ